MLHGRPGEHDTGSADFQETASLVTLEHGIYFMSM